MFIHIFYFIGLIITLPFLPILYLQAKKVRRNVPKLSEAELNIKGSIGNYSDTIRLITLGESTIAGVGIGDHKDAITGQIAMHISSLANKKVEWEAIGKSGYSAMNVANHLVSKIPATGVDIIVIGLGANDAFKLNTTLTWQIGITQVILNIRKTHKDCPIVIANMPPIGQFPAFPILMRVILGSLITLHGLALNSIVSNYSNVLYLKKKICFKDFASRCSENISLQQFFSDGVHPSTLAYSIWGQDIAESIIKNRLI